MVPAVVKGYTVHAVQDEDGGYVVTVPSLPGCISQGESLVEAFENIAEAIDAHTEVE